MTRGSLAGNRDVSTRASKAALRECGAGRGLERSCSPPRAKTIPPRALSTLLLQARPTVTRARAELP